MKLIHRVLMTSVATTAFFSASAYAQNAQPDEVAADNDAIVVTGVISSAGQNKIDTSIQQTTQRPIDI